MAGRTRWTCCSRRSGAGAKRPKEDLAGQPATRWRGKLTPIRTTEGAAGRAGGEGAEALEARGTLRRPMTGRRTRCSDEIGRPAATDRAEARHLQVLPRFIVPLQAGEGFSGGVVAAHAVDSGAGRRGGRAEVNVAGGRGVMPPRRAEEKLAGVGGAAGNVAADEVGVHFFEGRGEKTRRSRMQSRNPGAKRSICASRASSMSTVEPLGT